MVIIIIKYEDMTRCLRAFLRMKATLSRVLSRQQGHTLHEEEMEMCGPVVVVGGGKLGDPDLEALLSPLQG